MCGELFEFPTKMAISGRSFSGTHDQRTGGICTASPRAALHSAPNVCCPLRRPSALGVFRSPSSRYLSTGHCVRERVSTKEVLPLRSIQTHCPVRTQQTQRLPQQLTRCFSRKVQKILQEYRWSAQGGWTAGEAARLYIIHTFLWVLRSVVRLLMVMMRVRRRRPTYALLPCKWVQ